MNLQNRKIKKWIIFVKRVLQKLLKEESGWCMMVIIRWSIICWVVIGGEVIHDENFYGVAV